MRTLKEVTEELYGFQVYEGFFKAQMTYLIEKVEEELNAKENVRFQAFKESFWEEVDARHRYEDRVFKLLKELAIAVATIELYEAKSYLEKPFSEVNFRQ